MVDYLELARRAQKPKPNPDPVMDMRRTDPHAQRLLAAGWKPKERGRLLIWANPETGFYCSQEVALHRLEARESGTFRTVTTQKSARDMGSVGS